MSQTISSRISILKDIAPSLKDEMITDTIFTNEPGYALLNRFKT